MKNLLIILSLIFGSQARSLKPDDHEKEMEEAREAELNSGFTEGDMRLTPEQKNIVYSGTHAFGAIKRRYTWPSTTIPYVIGPGLKAEPKAVKAIQQAIEEYHKYTCLRFVERTTESAYIRMYNGFGCHSPVGYRGNVNQVSLSWKCWWRGTVVHELAHSLGFFHEQSRPDRDRYVKIHMENISKYHRNNFEKMSADSWESLGLGTKYDYLSIMHYGGKAFGRRKMTIEALDPAFQKKMGQRMGFSETDKLQMNMLYKCPRSG